MSEALKEYKTVNLQDAKAAKDDDIEIDRLAELSKLDYERQREDSAKKLGIKRISVLDGAVKNRQREIEAREESCELLNGLEAWPNPVDGNQLAIDMHNLFNKHCILPTGGAVALTLWCIASYTINAFRIFPKLCLSSPEKRCGKSTTVDVTQALSCRSLSVSNTTSAAIFRAIELWQPTLFLDEGDTFVNKNEEMRGIINSGHRRNGAFVLRVVGEGAAMEPKKFSTWAPMVIAMIKTPPETIKDRSLMLLLRRKLSNEQIQRLPLEPEKDWYELRQKCQRWYDDHHEILQQAQPNIPKVGNDRAEDNWLPIIAIADLLGGEWPTLARASMQTIESGKSDDEESLGVMVLADIQQAFIDKKVDKISSQDLVNYLVDIEDRPWCEWKRGQPMTKVSLSQLIRPFGIKSKDVRVNHSVLKGYAKNQFDDAFNRYLASNPSQNATTLQTSDTKAFSVASCDLDSIENNPNATRKSTTAGACSVVAPWEPELEPKTNKEVIEL